MNPLIKNSFLGVLPCAVLLSFLGCGRTSNPQEASHPLTAVHTTHVCSSNDPDGEDVTDNTLRTTKTYTGQWLHVTTTEDGIGSNEHGTIAGREGKLLDKTDILQNNDVVGSTLRWEFTNWSNDLFVFTATDLNDSNSKKNTPPLRIAGNNTAPH